VRFAIDERLGNSRKAVEDLLDLLWKDLHP
jgi:hypothetical protein